MKSIEELKAIRDKMQDKMNLRKEDSGDTVRVIVGMATCGIAAGARPVLNKLVEEIGRRNLQGVIVTQTGCIGVCRLEPVVEVYEPGKEKVTYVKMDAEKAAEVVSEHLVNHRVINKYTIGAADSK
jgi:NADP-reducing hydrogenase subunit HndB